jgi:hypothetical protein
MVTTYVYINFWIFWLWISGWNNGSTWCVCVCRRSIVTCW